MMSSRVCEYSYIDEIKFKRTSRAALKRKRIGERTDKGRRGEREDGAQRLFIRWVARVTAQLALNSPPPTGCKN